MRARWSCCWRTAPIARRGRASTNMKRRSSWLNAAGIRKPPSGFGGASRIRLLARDVRVGFDLHEYVGRNQLADLDHRRGGTDSPEDLAVRAADGFPLADVRHVDPS